MYIRRIEIENIRSIEHLLWMLPDGAFSGWNVILGDNGAGKSSFLRAVALALLGHVEAQALRQDWNNWLRRGTSLGFISLETETEPQFDFGGLSVPTRINLIRDGERVGISHESSGQVPFIPQRVFAGWFSAAYGPFRRFSGGDSETERSLRSLPRLVAHLSIFGESIALSESLEWLRELKYKLLENQPDGQLLEHLKNFVNQPGFLPHETKLKDVSSQGVTFEDANGFPVAVEELSDGYRSVLSMTFELIRQLSKAYEGHTVFSADDFTIEVPGVVLIDEVDVHLHPTWQKRIGFWLTEHFPRIQFIVTTHSPLVCQAAEKGTIFLLPKPGSSATGEMLKGTRRDRLIYGDILDAYSTEAFGTSETRSDVANDMQERLAMLNSRELRKGLSSEEQQEQAQLRAAFPGSPHQGLM